jgi:hypothetical protein
MASRGAMKCQSGCVLKFFELKIENRKEFQQKREYLLVTASTVVHFYDAYFFDGSIPSFANER